MENLEFLTSIGVTDPKAIKNCLDAMEKYGENKWWLPDVDPREYAYYQVQEPILLNNNFHHFHESLELLLGRPVFTHEFALNTDGLIQEAQRAWTYQVGCTSDRERHERVHESIKQLNDWANANGKQVFTFNPEEEE